MRRGGFAMRGTRFSIIGWAALVPVFLVLLSGPVQAAVTEQGAIPKLAQRHRLLGDLYCDRGKYAEAVTEYAAAVKLAPRYAQAENNWGYCLTRMSKPKEGIAHYRRALAIQPDYPTAHNNLGSLYYRLHRYGEAREQFAAAVELRPNYVKARVNLAAALYRDGCYYRAFCELRRAKQVSRGYVEKRMDPARTRQELEKDLKANPNDPILKKALGELSRAPRPARRAAAEDSRKRL
jgi:tetratricopeptide (TPR) repeat protein